MITAENIIRHEFIGLDVSIVRSTNPQIVGLNGKIVDETRSMFTVDTKNGLKSVAKSTCDWKFDIHGDGKGNDTVIINGSKIIKRPYDRIGMKE